MNINIISGRLTRDPESKTVNNSTVEVALRCIGDLTGDFTAIKNFRRRIDETR